MPSAKKKKKKQKQKARNRASKTAGSSEGGAGASGSAATSTRPSTPDTTKKVPPPRSNDDIVGKSYKTSAVPKKAIVRELEAALRYEASSESRRKIVDTVAALSADGAVPDMDKIPLTYETKAMLDMVGGRCLLTYGKVSPFSIRPQSCPPGLKNALRAGDQEELRMAKRWTGEHAFLRLEFDVIVDTTRTDLSVYLGECFLRKEDLWKFAGKFKSGTGYEWPDYFSVVQCPFCCKMQLPSDPGGTGGRPDRLIMIMTNVSQLAVRNGSMHMPHRALPRLCCEHCFVSNLKSADEPALGPNGWKSYPELLNHGLVWKAAHSLVKEWVGSDGVTRESFLPDAHTLYLLYDECGLCNAVSEQIQDRQTEMMGRLSDLMKQKFSMG